MLLPYLELPRYFGTTNLNGEFAIQHINRRPYNPNSYVPMNLNEHNRFAVKYLFALFSHNADIALKDSDYGHGTDSIVRRTL